MEDLLFAYMQMGISEDYIGTLDAAEEYDFELPPPDNGVESMPEDEGTYQYGGEDQGEAIPSTDGDLSALNGNNKKSKGNRKNKYAPVDQAPAVPSYEPYIPPFAPDNHARELKLPESFNEDGMKLTPLSFFELFFDIQIYEHIAEATKANASVKQGATPTGRAQTWRDPTPGEIMIWIALCIYMGVFKPRSTTAFWSRDTRNPSYSISRLMTKNRWMDIKRWIHISFPPEQPLPRCRWFEKMQPLAGTLEKRWQRYVLPASTISVDEMMVGFQGRSHHIVRMPNKPIPVGYKLFALAEKGYTWAFMFTSRTDGFLGRDIVYPGPHPPGRTIELSSTSRAVFELCRQLFPYKRRFTLFCDNYFSNVALFEALKLHGMAACGTVRSGSKDYPPCLKVEKKQLTLPHWNDLRGAVSNGVLAVLWQDKTLVRFLTTAHDPSSFTTASRRRPRLPKENNKYRQMLMEVWGEEHRKNLSQPLFSVDYNNYMGGVDIADQYRSYYTTQQRCSRSWLPLFFWLLDTSLVNAFIIARQFKEATRASKFGNMVLFLRDLSWELGLLGQKLHLEATTPAAHNGDNSPRGVRRAKGAKPSLTGSLHRKDGCFAQGHKPVNSRDSRGEGYVTKCTVLPPFRLSSTAKHGLCRLPKPRECWFCRWMKSTLQHSQDGLEGTLLNYLWFHHVSGPKGRSTMRRTTMACSDCSLTGAQMPLCKSSCHKWFHEYTEDMLFAPYTNPATV